MAPTNAKQVKINNIIKVFVIVGGEVEGSP